jgi:hypothetical protein
MIFFKNIVMLFRCVILKRDVRLWLVGRGLHLVAAHLVVVQVFEPATHLVGGYALRAGRGLLGVFEDFAVDVDGTVPAQGQGDGVGGAGVEGDGLALVVHPDDGVEGVVAELGDDDLADLGIEAAGEILQQVVSHGPGCGCFFELEGDGVGLEYANPDGEDEVAADVLEDDDGHVGDGVHHEAANLHLDFFWSLGRGLDGGLGHD